MVNHFTCISDLPKETLFKILDESKKYKKNQCTPYQPLTGKVIGLWFSLPSTRTHISFCTAIAQLGGYPLILNPTLLQTKRGETICDTISSCGYLDALIIRVHDHDTLLQIKKICPYPVINALTSFLHPCQSIADLFTLMEHQTDFQKLKITYVGDGNNVCHSLMIACAVAGIKLTISTPKGHEPSKTVLEQCLALVKHQDSYIKYESDPYKAVKNSNIIYTDVWTSMGFEPKNIDYFLPYQINKELLGYAAQNYAIMHCLPMHRGEEIVADLVDSPNSLIWKQAENRLWTQKALLTNLIKHSF
jgi:ornithine carbamoyltransferase